MIPVERNSQSGLPAGFVTRLVAFVIDLAINALVSSVLTVVGQFVGRSLGARQSTLVLLAAITTVSGFLFLFAYAVLLTALGGQTVGKRIMGLRVVRTDGTRVKLWPAIKRFIGYILSTPFFWGYLLVLIDNRRRAFHDKLAGTMVIYYTIPPGELGPFERHLKAIQIHRQAKLAEERAAQRT